MHIQTPSLISIALRDIRKTQWKSVFICFYMISISIFVRKTKNQEDRVTNPLRNPWFHCFYDISPINCKIDLCISYLKMITFLANFPLDFLKIKLSYLLIVQNIKQQKITKTIFFSIVHWLLMQDANEPLKRTPISEEGSALRNWAVNQD